METIEDGVARMILYKDDEDIRSFPWDPDDLPDGVRSGDQFEVTFEDDDDIESEVVEVSYSEEMTEQRNDEMRIPTVENLVLGGAPESKIREFLENSGTSDEEIERIIDEYVDENDD
jgi:hypothetical protein